MYYTVFNKEFNIGFFSPKKDQCELCLAFREGSPEEKTELQEKYDTHLREKELSRIEKKTKINLQTAWLLYLICNQYCHVQ
jgi:hypothetical protein